MMKKRLRIFIAKQLSKLLIRYHVDILVESKQVDFKIPLDILVPKDNKWHHVTVNMNVRTGKQSFDVGSTMLTGSITRKAAKKYFVEL